MYAAFHGHVELVRMLLERGTMIDARGNDGWTALYFAASNEQVGTVRAITTGVRPDVNLLNKDSYTPSRLRSRQYQEIVELLSAYDPKSVEE
jgi:ankyrin repeat protein